MPRRSLELVKSTFFDDPWLKANISSVLIQSAFKLFLAYEQPWWRSLGLVAGRIERQALRLVDDAPRSANVAKNATFSLRSLN